jgi:hypothetical protein
MLETVAMAMVSQLLTVAQTSYCSSLMFIYLCCVLSENGLIVFLLSSAVLPR